MERTRRLSRREAIIAGGAVGLGAASWGLLGCGEDEPASPNGETSAGGSGGASVDCVLTPQQTEGPFYLDENLVRSDITEGRPGARLDLTLRVRDAASCRPVPEATVELWQADAQGVYSGFAEGEGETFLRGGQTTDADGVTEFQTIYPGWYAGRTTHIHVKVHVGGEEVHTGQLYFDEAVSDRVYASGVYAERGEPDVTNSSDTIYASGGESSQLRIARKGSGYAGELDLGVQA